MFALERRGVVKLHIQQHNTKEVVRATLRLDQHRVLSEPPQSSPSGQLALQHRTGIHIRPPLDGQELFVDPVLQLDQAILEQIMVVVVASVTGKYRA